MTPAITSPAPAPTTARRKSSGSGAGQAEEAESCSKPEAREAKEEEKEAQVHSSMGMDELVEAELVSKLSSVSTASKSSPLQSNVCDKDQELELNSNSSSTPNSTPTSTNKPTSTSKRPAQGTNPSAPPGSESRDESGPAASVSCSSAGSINGGSVRAGVAGAASKEEVAARLEPSTTERETAATYSIDGHKEEEEGCVDRDQVEEDVVDEEEDEEMETEMEKLAPIRRSSQELLSTVSECSEEMSLTRGIGSLPTSYTAAVDSGEPVSSSASDAQVAFRRKSELANEGLPGGELVEQPTHATRANEPALGGHELGRLDLQKSTTTATTLLFDFKETREQVNESQQQQHQPSQGLVAPNLHQHTNQHQHQEPASEQDLANSEHTPRSLSSEAAALTSALESDEDNLGPLAAPPGSGGQVEKQDQHACLVKQSSAEQRRRSTGSSGSGGSSSAAAALSAGRLLHHHHAHHHPHLSAAKTLSGPSIAGVDCPYVHDIVPLSPATSEHLMSSTGSIGNSQRLLSPVQPPMPISTHHHHKRALSHDDTMEAIEDDIEGEEQEMQELQRNKPNIVGQMSSEQPPVAALDIEPPPAFGGGGAESLISSDDVSGPHSILQVTSNEETNVVQPQLEGEPEVSPQRNFRVESFVEEEEDDDNENLNDNDQESSISVSQKHGVVVIQETSTLKRRQVNRGQQQAQTGGDVKGKKSSNSQSSSSSSSASPSDSNGGRQKMDQQGDNEDDEDEDQTDAQVTPVKSMSHDSATHAILEHLSLHHPGSVQLDEPPPAMESSMPIDPQQRRESWRRESIRSAASSKRVVTGGANAAPETDATEAPSQQPSVEDRQDPCESFSAVDDLQQSADDNWTIEDSSVGESGLNPKGTMQRRTSKRTSVASVDVAPSAEPSVAATAQISSELQRRGPPLAQLKPAEGGESRCSDGAQQSNESGSRQGAKTQPNRQPTSQSRQLTSGSMATDTSICSSCSCQEPSLDLSQQEQQSSTQNQLQQQPPLVKSVGQSQGGGGSGSTGATWMSQEEGTVFTENYWLAHWLYISEHEESEIWRRAIDMNNNNNNTNTNTSALVSSSSSAAQVSNVDDTKGTQNTGGDAARGQPQHKPGELSVAGMPKDMTETGSTISERSFSSRYKSTTRKMIHRRATIEMYKRIMANNLRKEKRVEISRSNGEFGFRIHGSRPVVVSAIERGTSAETCGLQVGDLIYAINGTNILDMAHSDVVHLAHKGKLEHHSLTELQYLSFITLTLLSSIRTQPCPPKRESDDSYLQSFWLSSIKFEFIG